MKLETQQTEHRKVPRFTGGSENRMPLSTKSRWFGKVIQPACGQPAWQSFLMPYLAASRGVVRVQLFEAVIQAERLVATCVASGDSFLVSSQVTL